MQITAAHIQNFKRIEDIKIVPGTDRTLVLIGGKNAQGKSSVLDALTAAFGGKKSLPADPVRHGAESAEILVELDGGELSIMEACVGAIRVVAAWGNHGALAGRDVLVRELLARERVELWHLGTTLDGYPKHPLARGKHRIPQNLQLQRWGE